MKTSPIILNRNDYLDQCSINFCGGIMYTCEQLQEYMKTKRTVKQINDYIEYLKNEVKEVNLHNETKK